MKGILNYKYSAIVAYVCFQLGSVWLLSKLCFPLSLLDVTASSFWMERLIYMNNVRSLELTVNKFLSILLGLISFYM